MKVYFLVFLSVVRSQEVSTPSSLLHPRNPNHHAFDAEEFINSLNFAEPTKQGPVLFPNDAPPPPRPPLIVTSRPLVDSIARSELGSNNTETSQSQLNGQRVSFVPYLSRVNDYRPYNPSPTFNYNFVPTQIPYAEVVKKTRLNSLERDHRYNDYEEQTILPPIYKALSDHANEKVLKLREKQPNYNYKAPIPDYSQNNNNDGSSEYDQNQNYAFSYTVKDKKTGDDFSHSQHSSGSATNGEYRVRLPDGRMQIVSYTADENGYKADVRYDETNGNSIDNPQGYNDYGVKKHNDYGPTKTNYGLSHDYVSKNDDYRNNEQTRYELHKHNDYVDRNRAFNNGHNDYSRVNNDFVANNLYVAKNNNAKNGIVDYTDVSNIIEKKEKPVVESDYYYPDVSKEYYNDYSSEYNSNTEPHKSKYSTFVNNDNVDVTNTGIGSTVKPSYEELKPLFVTKGAYNNYDTGEFKSTTPSYDGTSEHVVVIGAKPNLYTNIRNSIPSGNLVSYPTPKVIVATTPSSYLVSTITSLKNKVHLATKPILSERYIDKINKYLSFN